MYVYFISSGDRIKIGTTTQLSARLDTLKREFGESLQVLKTTKGGHQLEALFHQMFGQERTDGEWFRRSDRLLQFIEQLPIHVPSNRRTSNYGYKVSFNLPDMTLRQLNAVSGIPVSTLHGWISGKVAAPVEGLVKLKEALNLQTIDELLCVEKDKPA